MKKKLYIVIEKFSDPFIVTDEEGKTKFFDTVDAASIEAEDCQDGQIVEI